MVPIVCRVSSGFVSIAGMPDDLATLRLVKPFEKTIGLAFDLRSFLHDEIAQEVEVRPRSSFL
jgi:hypothetical protein